MNLRPTILLVEDNHDHLRLTRRLIERSGLGVTIQVARDGEEALASMQPAAPALVLLDLNMPRVSGRDVLKQMKADPRLAAVPVVVVSSSNRQEDMTLAAELGAAGYISKGEGLENLTEALGALKRFLPDSGVVPPPTR